MGIIVMWENLNRVRSEQGDSTGLAQINFIIAVLGLMAGWFGVFGAPGPYIGLGVLALIDGSWWHQALKYAEELDRTTALAKAQAEIDARKLKQDNR